MAQVYEPARQTTQSELVQGVNLRVVPTLQAGNAAELQRQIRAAVTAFLLTNPDAELVDVQCAGGGPGNVFGALVLATVGDDADGAYFLLSDVVFDVLEAADQRDLVLQLQALFQTTRPDNTMLCWDQAIGGAGSPFLAVVASIPIET
jgi:hypothetical protein